MKNNNLVHLKVSKLFTAITIIITTSNNSYAASYYGRPMPDGSSRPSKPTSGYIGRPSPSAGNYDIKIIGAIGGNEPGISMTPSGTPVINIVAPNDNGLSHNKYQQFNVNEHGVVLNNSLTSGMSQLSGKIDANPNFRHREANIILNEVVGRNPSLLNGQQEIFGKAADYVLANPIGISCQSCGFINTNSTSLVVGYPLIENGQLKSFSTLTNRNSLNIKGDLKSTGVVNLIAPQINSDGEIIVNNLISNEGKVTPSQIRTNRGTPSTFRAISGLNKVAINGEILVSEQPTVALDSYYFGSMKAGRINIINTAKGSGVKLAGNFLSENEINIRAYNIRNEIQVNNSRGDIDSNNNHQKSTSGTYINEHYTNQSLSDTVLRGNDISLLAENDMHLTAANINGKDIVLKASNIVLDGKSTKQTESKTNNQWKNSWEYNVFREKEKESYIGTTISAIGNIKLISTKDDVELLGVTINSNRELNIKAERNLHINGVSEKYKSSENGYQKNHTASLITGNWSSKEEIENLKSSQFHSEGALIMEAGNNVIVKGSKINSNHDFTINANNKINIDVQKTKNIKTTRDDKTYWGNIGGGNNYFNNNSHEVNNSSELTSGGTMYLNGRYGVKITGSKARGKQGGLITTTNGNLIIDNALSTTNDNSESRTGTVFNITSSSQKKNNSYQQSTASELKSDTNLKLVSLKNIDITGSQLDSNDKLIIFSQEGSVNMNSAKQQQKIDENKTALTFNGYANEKGDKQYNSGFYIEHTTNSEKTIRNENVPSILSGGSIDIDAGKDVTFIGSKLITSKGDANIDGDNVSFMATNDTTTSEIEQVKTNVGLYYTGGIDKVGNGFEFNYEHSNTHIDSSKAISSTSDVNGNMTINARDKLTQQGAQHSVGNIYKENATSIDHLATADTYSSSEVKTEVSVNIAANVDYSATTRPAENAVEKATELDIHGAINDIGSIDSPNVGIDIGAKGSSSQKHNSSSHAVVTSIKAGGIDINAKKDVLDKGTQYEANKSSIKLTADNHIMEAAISTKEENIDKTYGSSGMRIFTSSGSDFNLSAKGEGGTHHSNSNASLAIAGNIDAIGGVDINVNKDAIYQGSKINGGNGKISINAGSDIQVEKTWDKQSENHSTISFNASAKGGTTTDSKNFGIGFGGSTTNIERNHTTAAAGNMNALQGVELNAEHNIRLQGTDINSKGDISIIAGNKALLEAIDSSQSYKGNNLSGKIDLNGAYSDNNEKNSGNASIALSFGMDKVNESSIERKAVNITSNQNVTVEAKGKDNNILHLQGTKINSDNVILNTENGSILMESTQNEQYKDNWNFGIKANAKGGQSFNKDSDGKIEPTSGKDTHTLGTSLNIGIERLEKISQNNASIKADEVTLNSGEDIRLSGGLIDANNVKGKVDGALYIESLKDIEKGMKVNVDTKLSYNDDSKSSLTSKLSNIVTPHYSGNVKDKLNAGIDKVAEETINAISLSKNPTEAVSYNKADDKVTLPETLGNEKLKKPLWDKGVSSVVGTVKDKLTGPEMRQGHIQVNVDIVDNNAVEEQSAIIGKYGVSLHVGGETKLVGGAILSQQGKVELGDSKVSYENIYGNHYHSAGRGYLNVTPEGLAINAIKQGAKGDIPLGTGYTSSQRVEANAGIFSHE